MKHLAALIRIWGISAFSVALNRRNRQTAVTPKSDSAHFKKPDRSAVLQRELVLLDVDGTVFAREITLALCQKAEQHTCVLHPA